MARISASLSDTNQTRTTEFDMLDQAFEALNTYDWGTDRNLLNPIDEAVVKAHGNDAARKELETRGRGVLKTGSPRRQRFRLPQADVDRLGGIGAGSGRLLPEKDNSHMARYAWSGCPRRSGAGLARSTAENQRLAEDWRHWLAGRAQDTQCVHALVALLGDNDPAVVRAAALCAGRHRHRGSRQGIDRRQVDQSRREDRHHRRQPRMCRSLALRRQEGRRDGGLQIAERRERAEARSFGGEERHVGRGRQEELAAV